MSCNLFELVLLHVQNELELQLQDACNYYTLCLNRILLHQEPQGQQLGQLLLHINQG